ncbi:MAG: hypothetical protein GY946_16095 [bacterium]|nr:hypothetical protein [bacterium]
MKQERYLGMRPGDLDGKPYARHWNPEMAPMQEHVRHALLHGPEACELGFPITEANQLLEPGYLPLENGYTRLRSGQVFVAVLTKMPRVTSKMIDWWFGWHYMESERYKLWHPRAHVSNGAEKMIGDDPALSDREKYLHNPNYVTEYVGNSLLRINITFSEPSELVDTARFDEARIGTMVCGTVSHPTAPVAIARMIHQIRETDDGCEMRSRFWMGAVALQGAARVLDPIVPRGFLARRATSLGQGRDLVAHCAAEMNHLASFLPELYADYRPAA